MSLAFPMTELWRDWMALTSPDGQAVDKERLKKFRSKLPSNPLAEFADAEIHQYLREGHSETGFVVDEYS